MNVVSQGNVRRGSFAAYLPIDHADIEDFLNIKDIGNPIQELSIGVCVSDEWMRKMIDGDQKARKIWGKVIKKRFESGYPYIMFSDNANNNAPQVYKDKGLTIHNSNLCSEIFLSNAEDESFVCDLSSLNLERWDDIKDTDAIETLVYFLDAVMSEFIDKTEGVKFMEAPRKFAINQRALGIGVLGWHSLLQSKNIPFESMDAKILNLDIWETIRTRADKATSDLARLLGEPPLLEGYGRRNTTTLAIAPTTSSSFILGQVSPSIEPLNSNYYVKDLAKGKFTYKNPYLMELLKTKDQNTQEVWKSILVHGGSVQHLEFLTQEEKDVYKTFGEISQKEIIIQAAQRQKYIDQGQSLNLMIPPNTKPKEVNELMIFAWEQGIKSLYYQRSSNPASELGIWDLNDSANNIHKDMVKLQETLIPIEQNMGHGGDETNFIKRNKIEQVGAIFNDFPSIRIDEDGRSQPSEMLVSKTGTFKNHDSVPHIEEVDNSSNFPGGNDEKIVGNRYSRTVGSGGIQFKTTGATEIGGTTLKAGYKKINMNSSHGIQIASESYVEIQSLKSIILRTNRQVYVESGLGVKGNLVVGGGASFEGEVYVQHLTGPLEVHQTQDTTAFGKFATDTPRTLLIGEAQVGGIFYPVYALPNDNTIMNYPHSHHHNGIAMRLTKSNDDVREFAQSEQINNHKNISQSLPQMHERKIAKESN